MKCPPLGFGLPYSCDPMVTFLSYMIPVVLVCGIGIAMSVWMLVMMHRERAAERAARAPEAAEPIIQSARARRIAARAARGVIVVPRGSGDGRTTRVKTERAIASVLDEVDS